MLQWVVEAARRADVGDHVLVATPDIEIAQACARLKIDSMMTSNVHPSGTDRIAEVARAVDADIYVNVQGDEPLIPEASIRACAEPLLADPAVQMGSVWAPCSEEDHDNPAVVKCVTDAQGFALYFSRYCIPFARNPRISVVKRHVGIYAYRKSVLAAYSTWPQTPLEVAESLEQLRFLENGVRIKLSEGLGADIGVDTPEQADQIRAKIAQLGLA